MLSSTMFVNILFSYEYRIVVLYLVLNLNEVRKSSHHEGRPNQPKKVKANANFSIPSVKSLKRKNYLQNGLIV